MLGHTRQNPSWQGLTCRKTLFGEDKMILEDSNQHGTACVHPETHFESRDKPRSANGHGISLHAIQYQGERHPPSPEEEAFLWVVKRVTECRWMLDESGRDAYRKGCEQHEIQDEEDASDCLEPVEIERLLCYEDGYCPSTHCAGEPGPRESGDSVSDGKLEMGVSGW